MKYLSSCSSLLPLIIDEEEFFLIRQKLLAQSSVKEILVNENAARIEISKNNLHNQGNELIIKEQENKFTNRIFIHYTHETRFDGLKRSSHEIHDEFFKNTDYQDIRLIVGHRNNPNMEFELVRKRSNSSLLKNQPPKKSKNF